MKEFIAENYLIKQNGHKNEIISTENSLITMKWSKKNTMQKVGI